MNKPVILTGLRVNNDLHIGNYFGALKPIIDMTKDHSEKYQVNLFIPDLHSFTTPINHTELQTQIVSTLRAFIAAGLPLGSHDVYLYRQSYIPAHSELTWILSCFTGFGEFGRMAEFKDKSGRLGVDHIGVGQFVYPALQAADILLYNAQYIPVGEDQRQHIEYARNIAERMNNKFGEQLFNLPSSMEEMYKFFNRKQGLRIRDLVDPTKKMSKSGDSSRGAIFLSDRPEDAAKKIMSATTDSLEDIQYDYDTRPGISNLLDILKILGGDASSFIGQKQYGLLKTAVAEAVSIFLSDFQSKLEQVDDGAIAAKLTVSEKAMNVVANNTLLKVQRAVGLRSTKET